MKQQEPMLDSDIEVNSQLKRMLYGLILIVLGTYLVMMISSLYWGEWTIGTSFFISIFLLLLPFSLLRRGHFIAGGFLLVVIALVNVTILATMGQGIHDIAIAAYPTMIVFASLALNRQGYRVSLALIFVSIVWLIVGESRGLFISKPIHTPDFFDFVIITSIIMATALVVNILANNMRKNLTLAKNEIDQRKQVEAELREKEVQYHNLADAGIALIWTSGIDKSFTYLNLPWLAFTGRTLEQELGNGWTDGVYPDDYERCMRTYINAFDNREVFEMEYRMRNKNGEYRWIQDLGTPNFNSNQQFVGYIGYCFDITERKLVEEQLRFQSTHDVLTGIYNRTFFEEELARFERGREYPISIVIADVDGLKMINDSIGHAAGDELLRKSANLLSSVFRTDDVLARIGGDEFAVLLPSTDEQTVKKIVARVRDHMAEQNKRNPDSPVNLSLGSATTAQRNLVKTFTIADQRMYAEKAEHKAAMNQIH